MEQGTPKRFGAFGYRLQFEADGFLYGGQKYFYAAVRGVEFKKHTFMLTRQDGTKRMYDSRLRVIFADGKKLNLYPNLKLGRNQRTEDKAVQDSMQSAAEWLQAYTFDARMDGYEAEFAKHKYVTWGTYQIAANGDLFRRHAFCMNLKDKQARCLLYDFHLTCVIRPKAWWKRILWHLMTRKGETLDLRRDRDCFLYFMRKYLGMFWPDETLRLHRGKAAAPDARKAESKTPPPPNEGGARAETGGAGRKEEAPPPPPPPVQPMPSYPQHLATLGLGPEVEWDVVKATYRQLARKHHPDLVRGRGAKESEVKASEEMLKKINEAYGWLEDFYRLKPKR